MSCNHCNTKFGLFHKELGCSNCGLSLCSKCLQQKCQIPSKGQGEYKVCRVCYSKLTKGSNDNEQIIPPDRFLKRLENLENPFAPPITVYRQNPNIVALKSGLSSIDQNLVDRLEKLKEKRPLPPSDSEIRDRLAKLKGDQFAANTSENKQPLYTPDLRSDQEKVDSLLEQFADQQGIDTSYDQSHDEIARRLAVLKGEGYKENKVDPSHFEEVDSEEEIDQITKKIVSQVSLDERCPIGSSKKSMATDDEEDIRSSSPELPWCVLCNKDATYRCYDCGGDLYCTSCNTEVHKDWGDTDHRVVPYKLNK